MALDPSLQWNTLHTGIQTTTLVSRIDGSTQLCSICREPDHTVGQCALSYLQPGTAVWPPGPRAPLRRRPESLANICESGVAPSRACIDSGMSALHAYGETLCSTPCSL